MSTKICHSLLLQQQYLQQQHFALSNLSQPIYMDLKFTSLLLCSNYRLRQPLENMNTVCITRFIDQSIGCTTKVNVDLAYQIPSITYLNLNEKYGYCWDFLTCDKIVPTITQTWQVGRSVGSGRVDLSQVDPYFSHEIKKKKHVFVIWKVTQHIT